MSITDRSSVLSGNIGSLLYEHLFQRRLDRLILMSAGLTALTWALVPLLRLHDRRAGEPAKARATG
jgi:hypothetical protein